MHVMFDERSGKMRVEWINWKDEVDRLIWANDDEIVSSTDNFENLERWEDPNELLEPWVVWGEKYIYFPVVSMDFGFVGMVPSSPTSKCEYEVSKHG